MTAGQESGWLAIKVDFLEDESLVGILWYNNGCSVAWARANAAGQKMASGVYFARFVQEDIVLTRRLLMIK